MDSNTPPAKKGLSAPAIAAIVLAAMVVMTLSTLGVIWVIKEGFKSATSSFQFDVDASGAHARLKEYYDNNNGHYPTDQEGIKNGDFSYDAQPAGCDNMNLLCSGYTITHRQYDKSATHLDYAASQKN